MAARVRLRAAISVLATAPLLLVGLPVASPVGLPAADPPVAGAYYVAPSGDDSGPGTLAAPWRTVQHAAATLLPGQTVYLRAGTYAERLVPARSGTAAAVITYAAYPGEQPVIDGAALTLPVDQSGLVQIRGRAWIRVVGLSVRNARGGPDSAGILVDRSQHIVLEANRTEDTTSSGIGVWGSRDVTVLGNEIVRACAGGRQESLSVAGTDTFVVEGNTVRDTAADPGKEGIDVKAGSAHGVVRGNTVVNIPAVGIYVDAWDRATTDIQVTGNVVRAAGNGIVLASEMGGLLSRVRVVNNLVTDSVWLGISLSANGDDPSVRRHPMTTITVINNTVWANGYRSPPSGGEPWGGGIAVDNRDVRKTVVRNNIVSRNNSFQLSVVRGLARGAVLVDHNLIDGYRGATWDNETYGSAPVKGSPRFVDAASGDVHLSASSPAIDRGSRLAAPGIDFDGVRRPAGAGVDIGAFEYVGG